MEWRERFQILGTGDVVGEGGCGRGEGDVAGEGGSGKGGGMW